MGITGTRSRLTYSRQIGLINKMNVCRTNREPVTRASHAGVPGNILLGYKALNAILHAWMGAVWLFISQPCCLLLNIDSWLSRNLQFPLVAPQSVTDTLQDRGWLQLPGAQEHKEQSSGPWGCH